MIENPAHRSGAVEVGQGFPGLIAILPAMDRLAVNQLDEFFLPVSGDAHNAKEIAFDVNGLSLAAGIKKVPGHEDGTNAQGEPSGPIHQGVTKRRWDAGHEAHAQLPRFHTKML